MKGKRQKEKKFKWMKVVYTSRRKMEGPLQNARYELYPKITMEAPAGKGGEHGSQDILCL
jgi:hypothetical protein